MSSDDGRAGVTWNHRVIRHKEKDGEEYLAIHEVYYDMEMKPKMVTEKPIVVMGEDIKGMQRTLTWMMDALQKPILDYSYFEQEPTHQ